jgi:hypothetical protein
MTTKLLTKPVGRHPNVPLRRVFLAANDYQLQIAHGLYTTQRGERLAIPVDKLLNPHIFLDRYMWERNSEGTFRPGVKFDARKYEWQSRLLTWLRDNVHQDIPYWYYMAILGHDLHYSTYANLFAKHWHKGWANPFEPEKLDEPLDPTMMNGLGFLEELGWLSGGKVTEAFISEEIDELVSTSGTEYADFDFHEVGTSTTAEANSQTALIATSGISRVTGTPTDADPIYRNVGIVTADASETWEEHGLFNNSSGVALMDRSLTGGQSVTSSDQVQYTYQLTKTKES